MADAGQEHVDKLAAIKANANDVDAEKIKSSPEGEPSTTAADSKSNEPDGSSAALASVQTPPQHPHPHPHPHPLNHPLNHPPPHFGPGLSKAVEFSFMGRSGGQFRLANFAFSSFWQT